MSNINVLTLAGNVTRDPETRTTPNGYTVSKFSVANNGFKEGDVLFMDCEAWGKTAEVVENYIRKGSAIVVTGRLRQSEYTDREGNKRRAFCLNVNDLQLPPKSQNETRSASAAHERDETRQSGAAPRPQERDDERSAEQEDELPF